jgi:hypothetical protein
LEYELITENDRTILEAVEAKEYIASYYEDLYQARDAPPGYESSTKGIIDTVKEATRKNKEDETESPITHNEVREVIKKLKRKKSSGPDGIPNEAIIEADNDTREIYRRIFNDILTKETVPDKWQLCEITRRHKGRGKKGKCSNERGITVASNMGKVFERIMNNRALNKARISDAQAGARKEEQQLTTSWCSRKLSSKYATKRNQHTWPSST